MVNSILESKLKCNNYYSEQEELYKKYMKDRYGVSIQMICWRKYAKSRKNGICKGQLAVNSIENLSLLLFVFAHM